MIDEATGEIRPVTLVTDNGGPFRSARFAKFIDDHPELAHVRPSSSVDGHMGALSGAFPLVTGARARGAARNRGHTRWACAGCG
ncbi:MAG: hypothetical protein ACRDPT_16225, partial [Streptomycetales bacterium]